MLAELGDVVELVARHVVAQPVAGVLAEPQVAGARIDRAADAVADADRHQLGRAVRRIDAAILRQAGRRQADVAGRPERDVEPALAVGHQVLPAMRHVGRHVVVDDLAVRRLVEVGLGIVVFVELVDVDHVERAVHEGDAGRHAQAGDEGLHHLLAALRRRRRAPCPCRTCRRTACPCRPSPSGAPAARRCAQTLDLEARRQLDVGQDLLEIGLRRRQSAGPDWAPGPSAPRSRRPGTSRPADWPRSSCCWNRTS